MFNADEETMAAPAVPDDMAGVEMELVTTREVPVAAPMLGVIRVGVLARTNAPLPVGVKPSAVCTLLSSVNEFIAEGETPTKITPFATVVGKL